MKVLTVLAILLSSVFYSYAQDSTANHSPKKIAPWYVERFKLTAGGFLPINNTSIQVSAKGGIAGTDIDFEHDLGFNSDEFTFLANLQWRISRRSRLSLNYYNIPRNSNYTLKRDIVFQDNTYHVDATVNSFFNTSIFQFSYGYAILSEPKYEVGVMIGAHIVGAKAGISLITPNVGASTSNDFGFTAPLPDLGIWGGYAFSDRFAANLEFDYLALTVGDIDGSIVAYNIALLYKLSEHFQLALSYTGLNFKVTADKPNVEGQFKWSYNGPSLGLTYSFGKKSWIH